MARSYRVHKYTLVVIKEVTNFMVSTLIHQFRSDKIGDTLMDHVFSKYSMPEYMIMDQDSTFVSMPINYLCKTSGIKTVAPCKH